MTRIWILPRSELLAAGVLVATTAVLVTQFLSATPVVVVAIGEQSTRLGTLGRQFTLYDVVVITVAACLAGASATMLLDSAHSTSTTATDTEHSATPGQQSTATTSNELLQTRRQEWEAVSERLASNEEQVYQIVLEADGVLPQSEIVERTDLSKATISRTLDSLEAKDLVERKRHGMGNTVLLR